MSEDDFKLRRQALSALFGTVGIGTAAAVLNACVQGSQGSRRSENVGSGVQALGTTQSVDTMANLQAATPDPDNPVVVLLGYWAAGDGGGGVFWWDASDVLGTAEPSPPPQRTAGSWSRARSMPTVVDGSACSAAP